MAQKARKPVKKDFLRDTVNHIEITKLQGIVPLVESMKGMAFSSRDLHRAASIYERMLRDKECGVILCLAGSLISAGLKKVFVDLLRNNMVDAIVSTGANIIDQDFFEALGFKNGADFGGLVALNQTQGTPAMIDQVILTLAGGPLDKFGAARMRILQHVNTLGADNHIGRVQAAVHLVASSAQAAIQK